MAKLVALLVCLWLPFTAHADTPVDFSGQWIAVEKNDDAGDAASHANAPSGDRGGGRGGHGGMGGGRHGRAAEATGHTAVAGDGSAVPRLHARGLIIRQSDTVFDIDASGQRMAYRFDNRHNYGPPYGGTVTLTWVAPEMTIETHPDNGGTIVERYTLADDGQHLTLAIRIEQADGSARDVRREFARGDGTASPASALP